MCDVHDWIGFVVSGGSVVLRGVRVFGESSGTPLDIVIRDGLICSILEAGSAPGPCVDLTGAWVMPGAIDAHVHPIHNETLVSTGKVAPAGGVTTVLHHLYPFDGEALTDAIHRATSESLAGTADFGFHVRLVPRTVGEALSDLAGAPGAVGVKVFLAHSDPSVTCTLGELYTAMRGAAACGLPVIVHAEFGDVVAVRAQEVAPTTLAEWSEQRPKPLESACVEAVCALAGLSGATAYIAHASCAEAVEAALAARRRGAAVYVETCPHYLYLDTASPLGGLAKVAPPLREASDVVDLRAAVGGGLVDVVASDHCGYDREEKSRADMARSSSGLPGIEALVRLLLHAAIEGEWLTPTRMVESLCSGPARAFGLRGKGHLVVGADADILVLDLSVRKRIDAELFGHNTFYSPYQGMELRGSILQVWRRGLLVAEQSGPVEVGGGTAVATVRGAH